MASGNNTGPWLDAIDLGQSDFTMRLYDIWSRRVATTSIHTIMGTGPTGQLIEMPNTGLYTNMPANAKCVFSIAGQEDRQPRHMKHMLPTRVMAVWTNSQIQEHANKFRAACPEEADAIVRPTQWEHLFDYFDASDLWYFGAWNMWAVIRRLCDENEAKKAGDSWDPQMPPIIDDWVYRWLTHSASRDSLASWDRQSDILTVLKKGDWENLGQCRPEVLDLVRSGLVRWFVFYHGGKAQTGLTSEKIAQKNAEDDKAEKDKKTGKPVDDKQARFAAGHSAEEYSISDDTRSNLDSSESRVNSSKTGSAFLAVPAPRNQRSISAPSSVVGDIQAPRDDIGNPIIGGPPLGPLVEESTAIRNVIVATNKFTREVTIRYPKPKQNVPVMVIEQHQQNPSAVEPVAMDAKAEVAVQKPKKAGKKVKEPAAHVADGQKKVPKKSQNTHLAVSLPPQCSDSTNLKLYPVPSHHNSGPSTSRSQPVARQAQRPKTGSASTNGSQNGVQDKHVDGLSRSPPYGGNGDVRYMYSTTGPTRNLGPSSQRSKFAPPPGCLNSDKVGVPGEGTYLACGCVRCKEKSRSVFVPRFPNSAPLEEMLDTLKQMFGPFGAIERISPRQITSAFMRFFVVFESEESAVGAVKTLNGKLCGVGNRTVSVTHPFFSKYFVPIPQKSHGNGRTTSGPNSRRHSGESSQSRRAGLAEDRHSSALAQGQKHISSPQATEDRRNKENQGVPLPKDQPLTASQPLQDNRVEANHPVKKPSGTAKPNLIPCPPIELASHKVQPSLGSPLNVVNRMPSDPFMNQPNPNPAPTHHRTLHYGPPHALGPLPGSADRNQGSMSRRTVREFSGSTAGSNRPYQVSCPPQSDTSVTMGQMPPYPGYPVPMSQPFCQTAVPPAHPSFQGPYFQGQPMNHPGPHIHQPIHPGAPPMVVPGPYMFNSYMNPEGYGAVTAENCPPLGPDLQQMHSMHPSGPVWFNPAQPLYAPWGMPMPPYQGYPPHPMPGSCFPPTANEPPTCPPQPQYQGVLQSLPAAAEVPSNQTETPTQATTAELESETIRVRLPSTPPEATCKTADRSPELDLQPGASGLDELKTSEEGGPSTLPQELNRDENVDSDGATPSLDAAVAEREVDQATHMITKTTPTIAEEGLNGVQETILPDKESSGEGGAVSEVIGAEGETGNPEGILRDSQGQSNDAAESPSPPSSEASLPHELQPASIPRFVSQDIRLDPDFQAQMNTVVRRKPEHQTHWMTPHNSNVYSKPPGFGNHQASFSGPPESASYPVVIDYNNPFPHHAFHSPPVPPPMESSAEIHNLLYGDLFHPPPAFGSQPGNNDSVARKYNPVYEQQYGENGQPVGKTKQKKKNKAKNKKGAGSRPQTPSLPVEGDANPPAHGNSIRAQGDAAGQAHSGLGEVIFGVGNTDGTKANNMADGATAAETKKNGKKNKPNRDSQLSQGGNKPLEGSAACEGEELTAERRVQAKPEPQHVQTLGVNDSHTTLQGTEDKIGAVRVNKKTRGKGGVTRLESLFVPDDEKTKVMEVQTETGAESPRAPSKPEVSLHGSFKGLPKSFDPWPRRSGVSSPPSKKATLPKIVIQALKCENLAPTVSGDNPLTGTSESFFSAVSRLSSRENSPPGGEGVLIVNAEVDLERQPTPPFTPTKASPTSVTPARISTPSTATVNGDLSPPFPVAEKKVALGEDDDNNAAAPATETGTSEPSFIPVDQATAGPPGEAKTNGTKNKVKRKKNKKKQNSTQNGAGDKA